MASGFPGSIDSFTNPLAASALNSPSHAGQHQDLNDAVNKIETYMGLVKVIPTAATNGTIAANGTVTIGNGVSSVTVTAFSSLYDNYAIQIIGGSNSTEDNGRLVLGSANTGYYGNAMYAAYATPGTFGGSADNNSSQFSFIWRGFTTLGLFGDIHVFNPNKAAATFVRGTWVAGTASGVYQGVQNSNTSFTSFTISCASGTMTGGTIRVYGYRN